MNRVSVRLCSKASGFVAGSRAEVGQAAAQSIDLLCVWFKLCVVLSGLR